MTIENLHKELLQSEGVCTDTRRIIPGSLFFALKGERFDGNLFVDDALRSGCRLAVTQRDDLRGKPGVVYTTSVLETLQQLATFHRRQLSPGVLAITGSNGKTTTKELVAAVLGQKYSVLATWGNLNNHIGVPLTLLSLSDEEVAVVEMGANHPGEIATLAAIAEPDLGLITNVGKAHLEGFGSLEGVLQAKGELYDYLSLRGGKALVDGHDALLMEKARESGVDILKVGLEGALPVEASISDQTPFLVVDITLNETRHSIHTQLVGAYNLKNILYAVAAGLQYGVGINEITGAIAAYRPVNQRSQVIEGAGNTVILDAYNANPTSMREAVTSLLEYADGPTMVLLGDMAELGKASPEEHRDLAGWIGSLPVDRILLVGPMFSSAIEPSGKIAVFESRDSVETYLRHESPEGYSILVKGSRVMELERLTPLLVK